MWGASIGAVPAFIFTGILAIVGGVAALTGHTEVVGVAFGPVFGPHVSFGGGVAAAAFAGSRGFLETGRDIGTPLMGLKRVDVLFVGGAFGSLGYLINAGLVRSGAGNWTDSIAVTVVLTAMLTRLVFGKTSLIGTVSSPGRRFRPDDSAKWVAWQQDLSHVLSIGLAVGLMAAFLASGSGLTAGSDALAFGIATTVLIFMVLGRSVPVTHHIALPAALGVLHGAGFLGGVACGVAGALLGEAASRLFLIHGDTHIDPPAAGIAGVVLVLKVATALGWISGMTA
ncbi:MAG: permease [Vicinamibacterales bacterium]